MSLEEDGSGHFPCPPIAITVEDVCSQLRRLKVNKAPGPDGIMPRVLKVCADQLSGVLHYLFTLSLFVSKIPAIWKTYCIVPVPKKPSAKALKDLRPIALTSHVIKCFERTVLGHLRAQVSAFQDPLQFAYRGVGSYRRCTTLLVAQGAQSSRDACCIC